MTQLRFVACVGDSLDDAWFLAERFEVGPTRFGHGQDYRRTERWIGRVKAGNIAELWSTLTPLDGLQPGPQGEVYTLASRLGPSDRLFQESGLWCFRDSGRIEIEALSTPGMALNRLGRLRDGSLIAWEQGPVPKPSLVRSDGKSLSPIPLPPIRDMGAIDGTSPSFLVASSAGGEVTTWNGSEWSAVQVLPEAGFVLSLCVVSNDQAYLADLGNLWRWDGQRWTAYSHLDHRVGDVVFHQDSVVASLSDGGLARVHDQVLEPLPITIPASRLYSGRHALVMVRDGAIADTTDLLDVRTLDTQALAAAIGDREPLWRTAALDSDPSAFTAPLTVLPYVAPRPIRYWFSLCVGKGLDDAFFLASRTDDVSKPGPEEGERIVGRIVDYQIQSITTTRVMLDSICLVPSGRLYVAAESTQGGIWRTPADGTLSWERLDVPPMQDLFALDDHCVMAWGGVGQGRQEFFLFDGQRTRPIPAPPERVVRMHGCAPDWIVAVGHNGLIARWDGNAWNRWALPIGGMLGNVHVVSPDEMYATGPSGILLEGSRYGWTERAPVEGMAVGVTKWKGEVYVGDPVLALLRLDGSLLTAVELPAWPWNLYAAPDALIMVERDGFAETRDLQTVRRIGVPELEVALRHQAPLWR